MSFFVFEGERKMRNVIEVYVENLKNIIKGFSMDDGLPWVLTRNPCRRY